MPAFSGNLPLLSRSPSRNTGKSGGCLLQFPLFDSLPPGRERILTQKERTDEKRNEKETLRQEKTPQAKLTFPGA
jgi:hypothetical protein